MNTAAHKLAPNPIPGAAIAKVTSRRILIVDDEKTIREVIKAHLSSDYEVIDTGSPEDAVALAIAQRPDAILLDLSMPGLSGFELRRALTSLTFTHEIPIFIVSGQDERNSAFCRNLGAAKYFRKPVDFHALKNALAQSLAQQPDEQRVHKRFRVKTILKLRARREDGAQTEFRVITENVSSGGFLCACSISIDRIADVDVFAWDEREFYLGRARLVRNENPGTSDERYAFQFATPLTPEATDFLKR